MPLFDNREPGAQLAAEGVQKCFDWADNPALDRDAQPMQRHRMQRCEARRASLNWRWRI